MLRKNIVVGYFFLTALCWQFELTNSRTSTLWKLNLTSRRITTGYVDIISGNDKKVNDDKIDSESLWAKRRTSTSTISPRKAESEVYVNDTIFYIIASTLKINGDKGWIRESPEIPIEDVVSNERSFDMLFEQNETNETKFREKTVRIRTSPDPPKTNFFVEESLDCGKPVNFTYYDYLIGVAQRFNHPLVPEPEVAYFFLKSNDENVFKNFDLNALEKRLKRAKREKSRSVQLYNQIGNYWRIIGDTQKAIECFRRALAMSPTNSEVLLNLARVLYNLQYLDDAIHLTRRSLEMQPVGHPPWQQYFTLGEIFRAYGHFSESILHMRHALKLHPHHEPIIKALRDLESSPSPSLHAHTMFIIIALVFAVLVVVVTSSSSCLNEARFHLGNANIYSSSTSDNEPRSHRHFNRAIAMHSLKGFSGSRSLKHRKNYFAK